MDDIVEQDRQWARDLNDKLAAKDAEIERLNIVANDGIEIEHRLSLEIERLRTVIAEASTKLKLLYMAAGLGQRTGRDALADLSEEIKKLDAVVYEKQEAP